MEIDDARRILGVDESADPQTVRDAHRRRIRATHPDAGGSAPAAAGVNEAFALLRDRPPDTPPPTPITQRPTPPEPLDVDSFYRVDVEPDELLARLAEAGHEVGEVVFVDPHVGILEIVVGKAPGVGQLAVTVGPTSPDGTQVTFTLEPLGVTPAPPIGPVVDALMSAIRR